MLQIRIVKDLRPTDENNRRRQKKRHIVKYGNLIWALQMLNSTQDVLKTTELMVQKQIVHYSLPAIKAKDIN